MMLKPKETKQHLGSTVTNDSTQSVPLHVITEISKLRQLLIDNGLELTVTISTK